MELGVAVPNIGPMATREVLLAMADQAEEVGIDALWFGDHLAFPRNPRLPYPYSRGAPRYLDARTPILDPLAAMAAVVARTKRVRVGTSVLVLPYRHPLVTAKLVATIDAIGGGGRVILGVGLGWIPEEFAALNASIKDRAAVTDEQIRYFREVWSNESPQVAGTFYRLDGLDVLPRPARPIPIWIGGQTPAAMRRAARLGDGLHMIDLTLNELMTHVEQFSKVCAEAKRPFDQVTLSIRQQLRLMDRPASADERQHPIVGNVQQAIETLRDFKRLGLKHVCLGPRPRDGGLADILRDMEVIGKQIKPALS